jgi:anaerobic magnesium-protoporphyrin IX monomethyl ester cyclase
VTSVLLVYPFFRRSLDRSRFRFPPLGVTYVAASLREAGHDVRLLDCTFLRRDVALRQAVAATEDVVGVYCMATMLEDCRAFARAARSHGRLLVAGGPLPTCDPHAFLADFDVVVCGEGEQTMCELLAAREAGADLAAVPGVVCGTGARARASKDARGRDTAAAGTRAGATSPASAGPVADARAGSRLPAGPRTGAGDAGMQSTCACAPPRAFQSNLDRIPFPARDLLPNAQYIRFGKRAYGHSITTVMSTRGCPFQCEFCSNVVFGSSYRERSAGNVVDEIEQALRLGYERISFADDVFTLNAARVTEICEEIARRRLRFGWECLGRVDSFDRATAALMKQAGCFRVFFGIESGNDGVLKLMNKRITTAQARRSVHAAHDAGLEVGAFFILCYPGETDDTVLDTLRFAGSLPLDYVGLTMPYPLPGTALFERVGDRVSREWRPQDSPLMNQVLTFDADFSATKMRFAIVKGRVQFAIRRRMGSLAPAALKLFEWPTDRVFRLLR